MAFPPTETQMLRLQGESAVLPAAQSPAGSGAVRARGRGRGLRGMWPHLKVLLLSPLGVCTLALGRGPCRSKSQPLRS